MMNDIGWKSRSSARARCCRCAFSALKSTNAQALASNGTSSMEQSRIRAMCVDICAPEASIPTAARIGSNNSGWVRANSVSTAVSPAPVSQQASTSRSANRTSIVGCPAACRVSSDQVSVPVGSVSASSNSPLLKRK